MNRQKFTGIFNLAYFLPRTVGGCTEEVEEGAVNLLLHRLRGFVAEVAEDAVVEDDVTSLPSLDGLIGTVTAPNLGTEQGLGDAHVAAGAVDECTEGGKLGV